jgi:hypothetical protein
MFNNFDKEAIFDIFLILRQIKLIGLTLKETEYSREEIANLVEVIIGLADKGTNALNHILDQV